MIDPASIGDWAQALLMAGLLGGVGAALARGLREEERARGGADARPV